MSAWSAMTGGSAAADGDSAATQLAGGSLLELARSKESVAAPLAQLGVVAIRLLRAIASEPTSTIMATALLSIFAHALSALPGMDLHARRIASLDAGAPGHEAVEGAASNPERATVNGG